LVSQPPEEKRRTYYADIHVIWKVHIVLGEHDLVFTLDFPDAEKAMAASVALNQLTGISFTTSPVVEVEKFDRLMVAAKDI